MITFFSKSLVSLAVIAALWGPTSGWLGDQHSAGLSCRTDFSSCRVAGKVIPLVDRATVLGQIAAQAKNNPADQFGKEIHNVATTAFDGALDGMRAQARKSE